jgi:hypothetical protein
MPSVTARLPLALLALCACAGSPERSTSITQLHLADSAIVTIPDAAPDGQYTMSTIIGAMQARDGAVAVWTQSELYLFDSSGAYVGMPGRRGNGPGEFRVIGGVDQCSNGALTAWDPSTRHLTVMGTADGGVKSLDPGVKELFMVLAGCYEGRPVLVHRPFDFSSQELKQETLQVVRLDTAGTDRDTLFVGDGILHAGPVTQLFPAFRVAAARAGMLIVGDNMSGILRRWHGQAHDSIVIQLPHQAISSTAADSVKRIWYDLAQVNGVVNNDIRQMFDLAWTKLPKSDSIPLFSTILIDDSASVWISDYAGHPGVGPLHIRHWTRLADDGSPVASLDLPAGFALMQLTHGRALGIQENEDGSLSVELREIEKS